MAEVGKLFSRRAALTMQELAEGQCLKSCNVVSQGFENDGVQKKSLSSIGTVNASIQTKNCVAAL